MQIHWKICAVSVTLAALSVLYHAILVIFIVSYARKMKFPLQSDNRHVPVIMKKDPFLIIVLKRALSCNNVKKHWS